jgi:hypothetical protein
MATGAAPRRSARAARSWFVNPAPFRAIKVRQFMP